MVIRSPGECIISNLKKDNNRKVVLIGEGFPYKKIYSKLDNDICIITNRFDIYTAIKRNHHNTVLNDFRIDGSYKYIFLRILKDKAANHNIINQAANILEPGGTFFISGRRNEGIKTYVKNVEYRLGGTAHISIEGNGIRYSTVSIGRVSKEILFDNDYPVLRNKIIPNMPEVYTKPGIFGWNKIDEGSELLMKNVNIKRGDTVLDLGCGYGFLSIIAWQSSPSCIYATDNNIAAINACKKNFQEFHINGKVIASDCGDSIKKKFDIIICNPPFHIGFSEQEDITIKFLKSIRGRLKITGRAYLVFNKFIKVEKKLKNISLVYEILHANNKFKIISLKLR